MLYVHSLLSYQYRSIALAKSVPEKHSERSAPTFNAALKVLVANLWNGEEIQMDSDQVGNVYHDFSILASQE